MTNRESGHSANPLKPEALRPERTRYDTVALVQGQGEARASVASFPGRLALVIRGIPRSVVFACPCTCGDVIVINLDPAVADAWRMRLEDDQLTLLPSVWRTTGCRSHFILWRNGVWWCRWWPERREARNSSEEDAHVDSSHDDARELGDEWPAGMDVELREEWRRIRNARRSE